MKNIIEKYLPAPVSEKIINLLKWVKKQLRLFNRARRFGLRPFFKEVSVMDTKFLIQLQPLKNGCVDDVIFNTGTWEPSMSEPLAKYLRPGDTFLDIGANVGYHSLFVASLLKGQGAVHSFEPIPHLCAQIKASVDANQFTNVTVHQIGLGDRESEMPLYVRDENIGGSSLAKYNNLNLVKISETTTVQIKTLDSIFSTNTRVDLIKIDVEGYELEALSGAKGLLQAQKPIIFMEFSPVFYRQESEAKAYELIELLTNLGYSFTEMNGVPIDLNKWLKETDNPSQIDVICEIK